MEKRQLYRSRNNRVIGGVCAGLGEYFNIDPTIVRLLFVIAVLFSVGWVIPLYIVMLFIVPEEPLGRSAVQTQAPPSQTAGQANIYDVPPHPDEEVPPQTEP